MSEPKHTPEPWSRVDGYVIEAETPKGMTAVVCNTRNDTIPYKECRANAERIVACVNACAGIEDPGKLDVRAAALEAALLELKQMHQHRFPSCNAGCPTLAAIAGLEELRDALRRTREAQ